MNHVVDPRPGFPISNREVDLNSTHAIPDSHWLLPPAVLANYDRQFRLHSVETNDRAKILELYNASCNGNTANWIVATLTDTLSMMVILDRYRGYT